MSDASRILPGETLVVLAASTRPEDFGPDSAHVSLAIDLASTEAELGPWLARLPCPVIGIGRGPAEGFCDVVLESPAHLYTLRENIAHAPIAAMVLVQQLRLSAHLPMHQALNAESLAFATVQTGPDFRRWQAERRNIAVQDGAIEGPALLMERDDTTLRLIMNRASRENAMNVEMRDALVEAFELAALDPGIDAIHWSGRGKCFSTGGDVTEFGGSADPATAHWIRSIRLPAQRLLAVAPKLRTRVQGVVIGAAIELAAFGAHISAAHNSWFQLPELKYGLIPGAGGTVSIPRRIGRQRAAYMALSMRRISATTALEWGLIDALET